MKKYTVDFETYSNFDLDMGSWNYAADPSTEILCMAWCEEEGDAQIWIPGVTPEPPFVRNDTGDFLLEAHNASFEQSIWHHICVGRLGWAPMPPERWEDSMARCAAHALPLALDKAGAALNLSVQKDQEGKRNMQQLTKKRKPSAARPETRYLPGVCAEWDEKFEMLYSYCKTDVLAERALSQFIPPLSDAERKIWYNNQVLNLRGLPIDIPAVEASLRIYEEFVVLADKQAVEITEDAISSLRQLGQFKLWLCKKYPAFIPAKNVPSILETMRHNPLLNSACVTAESKSDRKLIHSLLVHADDSVASVAGDIIIKYKDPETNSSPLKLNKETIPALLKDQSMPDDVREALELRQDTGKSSVSKIVKMKGCADATDHRIRWCLQYHGASTGRESARLVNPQNLIKPSDWFTEEAQKVNGLDSEADPAPYLIHDLQTLTAEEILTKYGSVMETIAASIRGFIKAPEGRQFYAADYNAIEARVGYWLAGELDVLDGYVNGIDLYSKMAAVVYGRPINKKDNPTERAVGKEIILGCIYGQGWSTFQATCHKRGLDVDEKLARSSVSAFRKTYRKVVRMWGVVGDAAINCLLTGEPQSFGRGFFSYDKEKRFLYANLPSGRAIAFYHPLLARVPGYDGELKWELSFIGTDKTGKAARERIWASKLYQNIVQGIARDLMEHGNQRAESAGYEVILKVYDEVVAETNIGFGSVKEYEHLLAGELPEWAEGLPLTAEGWVGPRYRK